MKNSKYENLIGLNLKKYFSSQKATINITSKNKHCRLGTFFLEKQRAKKTTADHLTLRYHRYCFLEEKMPPKKR